MRYNKRVLYVLLLSVCYICISCYSQITKNSRSTRIFKAHSHNDYDRDRPLFDALILHFTSIEADIHLVKGTLYVAHDKKDIVPANTLQSMYLNPLQRCIKKNGGHVYNNESPLILLIDLKTDADSTYLALLDVMKEYNGLFAVYYKDKIVDGPVNVIISGNRPLKLMKTQQCRYACYDGRIDDLDSDLSSFFMPLISDNWTKEFTWNGKGKIPMEEQDKLEQIVQKAHNKGRHVRFWQTDVDTLEYQVNIWNELLRAGVDIINTDKIAMLNEYFNEKK